MVPFLRVALVAPFPIRKLYPEHCTFTKSGGEHPASWIVNLTRALAQRSDIEVHLLTVKSHLVMDARFFADGIHFHVLRGIRSTLQPLTLYEPDRRVLTRELRHIQPDIVESFGTEGPFSYAGITSGYPCAIKIQGIIAQNLREMGFHPASPVWWRYFITQFVERWTFQHSSDVIADNEFMAGFARRANPHIRVHYIPNLIAPQFFQVDPKWNTPRKNILYVGSLKKEKGVFDLIEAFVHLHNLGVQSELCIVGKGSTSIVQEIKLMAQRMRVADFVHLLGPLSHTQIAIEMQKAAFLVHPAWVDYSPNTVYEAMVAGLGVIATKVGGLPFMIDEGETGYLVEAHNPLALAAQMKELFMNPGQQQQMGSNAMGKMRARFNEGHVLEAILAVYDGMISRHGQSSTN
jgi:glycosyltransferase involved in cell wall biosynthesis